MFHRKRIPQASSNNLGQVHRYKQDKWSLYLFITISTSVENYSFDVFRGHAIVEH